MDPRILNSGVSAKNSKNLIRLFGQFTHREGVSLCLGFDSLTVWVLRWRRGGQQRAALVCRLVSVSVVSSGVDIHCVEAGRHVQHRV